MEKLVITYDPNRDEIIGVQNGLIYTHCHCYQDEPHKDIPAILVLNKKVFKKTWDNWLKQKQRICKFYNHFCGVMGYTCPIKYNVLNEKMYVNIWNKRLEDYESIEHILIDIVEFEELHDFEHG